MVDVAVRGCNVLVAEDSLDVPEVNAFASEFRGEGVAKRMGMYALLDARLLGKVVEHLADLCGLNGSSTLVPRNAAEWRREARYALEAGADIKPIAKHSRAL